MGYPIVNSVEGPLREITPYNCTEGCITRCLVYQANQHNVILVAYVLLLDGTIYLLDNSYIVAYTYSGSMMFMLNVKNLSGSSSQTIGVIDSFFSNIIQ